MKQSINTDSLVHINNDFFLANADMKILHIGKDFESFTGIIGYRCKDLESITVDEENPYYSSVDGILYSKDKRTLVRYPSGREGRSILIADHVRTLLDNSFSHVLKLQSVYTGPNLSIVGYDTFNGCSRLTELRVGRNVMSLPVSATMSCWNLQSIVVDIDNETYASYDGCLYTKDLKLLLRVPVGHSGIVKLPNDSVVFSKNCEHQWKKKVQYITEE